MDACLPVQVLWFFDPGRSDPYYVDGRCLIRYKDGRVKQSVIPQDDYRVPYAMEAHGVRVRCSLTRPGKLHSIMCCSNQDQSKTSPRSFCRNVAPVGVFQTYQLRLHDISMFQASLAAKLICARACPCCTPYHVSHPQGAKLPLEPRHVVEYAAWDDNQLHPLQRWMKEHVHATESPDPATRRGPRIGPTIGETVAIGPQSERDQVGVIVCKEWVLAVAARGRVHGASVVLVYLLTCCCGSALGKLLT